MKHDELAEFYKTQQSLTEWLEDISHKDAEAIRLEDNEKRERLRVLSQHTGIPFDEPVKFEATDLRDKTQKFTTYLHKHGDDLCALRLIPKETGLPKLRLRGKSVAGAYEWFLEQGIDAEKYRADYMPHTDTSEWSTIFVVNKFGMQGEIIRGGHYQLTQGFFDSGKPIIFHFDFKNWKLSDEDPEAKEELLKIASHLHIKDKAVQKKLKEDLDAEFVNDYLVGYLETVDTRDFGLWFVDYNRNLGKMFQDVQLAASKPQSDDDSIRGQIGCEGVVEGVAQVVDANQLKGEFPEGSILVCEVTTPEFVGLMQKSVGIVTDQGGILSHAAIVARELKKPCIVGTGDATKKIKTGQRIRVDATTGTVSVLS